jgi:hypothetical protein
MSTKQVGGLKPAQESVDIREQLNRFTILNWTCVQKIQSQMITQEEETVLPVGLSNWCCHHRTPKEEIITPIMNHFIG